MPNALLALAAYEYIAALAASQHGCKTNALLPLAASRMHCSIKITATWLQEEYTAPTGCKPTWLQA